MKESVKSFVINTLIILTAAAGVIILLRKGGKAGDSRVKQITAPLAVTAPNAEPIRPQTVDGKLDRFNESITLQQIRSWGEQTRYGFMLGASTGSKWTQPHARVTLKNATTVPTILEIEYTMPQTIFEMIEADPQARKSLDGVAVQVATKGSNATSSILLRSDPLRHPEHRKWLSCDLTLPAGTNEIDFWITGLPPRYDVSKAACAVVLPQFRVLPNTMSAAKSALTELKP